MTGWNALRLPSVALATALLLAAPALAQDLVAEIRSARGAVPKPVAEPPTAQLGWTSADKDFWISGESPPPTRDEAGEIVSATGSGTLGARYRSYADGRLSLATVPMIRAEAAWEGEGGRARPSVGVAILQELALALPEGLRFRAKGGIGDRTGLSLAHPAGASPGLALRGEAGLSGSLRPLGHPDARFDLQLIATQAFGSRGEEDGAPSSCELKLDLTRKGGPPLSLGASCPGAPGEGHITLHIGGRF
jgi:hypothetical protein